MSSTAGPTPDALGSRSGFTLNERVLSAGTTLRFTVLLALCAAGTILMTGQVVGTLAAISRRHSNLECLLAAGGDPQAGTVLGGPYWKPGFAAYTACMNRYVLDLSWVPFVAVVAVAVAAVGLYRLIAWRRPRRPGIVAVDRVDPALARRLEDLRAQSGLPGNLTISFVVDVCASGTGAVVYGTARRPVVQLDGGLLVAAQRADADSRRFEAVVLHELAHIANRDIGITYATVAVWRVFLTLVLPPELAASVYTIDVVRNQTPTVWQRTIWPEMSLVLVAVIGVLVYLVRSDILRIREVYADRTAVERGALKEWLLPQHATADAVRGTRRVIAAAVRLWRTHPSWPQRAAALDHPRVLFRVGGLPLFLAGVAGDLVTDPAPLYSDFYWESSAWQLLGTALVVGVGGVAVWRSVLWSLSEDGAPVSGWSVGWYLGLGLAAGKLLLHGVNDSRWWPSHPEAALLLVAAASAVMAWTAQFAHLRITTYRGSRLQIAMLLALVPSTLALAFVQVYWNDDFLLDGVALGTGTLHQLTDVPHPPLLLHVYDFLYALPGMDDSVDRLWWGLPLLWLAPLVAWTARTPTTAPGWLRAAAPQAPSLPDQRPPLRRAVGTGLAAGVLAAAAIACAVWATASVRRSFDQSVTGIADTLWFIVVVIVAMALAAAVAAATSQRYYLLQAMIAAGVACTIGTAAMCAHLLLDGCLGPLNVVRNHLVFDPGTELSLTGLGLAFVTAIGLPLAVVSAVMAHLAFSARATVRHREHAVSHGRTSRRPVLRRLGVGLVVLLTMGSVVAQMAAESLGASAPHFTPGFASSSVQRAPSPETVKHQLAAWVDLGGLNPVDAAVHAHDALKTALDAVRTGSGSSSDPRTAVGSACALAYASAKQVDGGFPMPVATGQPAWSVFVSRVRQAVTACHALEEHMDAAGTLAALDDLNDATNAGYHMEVWAIQVMGGSLAEQTFDDYTAPMGSTQQDSPTATQTTVTGYATRPADSNASGLPLLDQIVAAKVSVCVPVSSLTAQAGSSRGAWTLILSDGTTVATDPSWAASDFPEPLLPDSPGPSLTPGQCQTGLIPFDIPAADAVYPVEVANGGTHQSWRVPAPSDARDFAGPMTADQLAGALLTAADLPGYAHTGTDSEVLPTESELRTLDGPSCQQLVNGIEGSASVYGTVAEAGRSFRAETGDAEISLSLHAFPDQAAAQKAVDDARAGVEGCRAYTRPDHIGSRGAETVRDITAVPTVSEIGGASATAEYAAAVEFSGTSQLSEADLLVVRLGSTVLTVEALVPVAADTNALAVIKPTLLAAVVAQAVKLRSEGES